MVESQRWNPTKGRAARLKWRKSVICESPANLELFLGDLLGGILGLSTELGQALYLTPRVAMGRLDIIKNVTPLRLDPASPEAIKISEILKTAKTITAKRHQMTHGVWRISGALSVAAGFEPVQVAEIPLKSEGFGKAMPLTRLHRRVGEIRNLIGDVRSLTWQLRDTSAPTPSTESNVERLLVTRIPKRKTRKDDRRSPTPKPSPPQSRA